MVKTLGADRWLSADKEENMAKTPEEIREAGKRATLKLFGREETRVVSNVPVAMMPISGPTLKLAVMGELTLNERLAIAQAVYDKVAEAAAVYMDNGYSAEVVAKIAQRACLDAIEYRAHAAGLLDEPRD